MLVLLSIKLSAQDYIVKEKFEPSTYSDSPFGLENANHRMIYSWGLNNNLGEDKNLVKLKGSNFFNIRYQYNQKLVLGSFIDFGIGYNWDGFNLHKDTLTLFRDSLFRSKRKMRFQNISGHVGFKFQTNEDPYDSYFLQFNIYGDYLTRSFYIVWDEIGDVKQKIRQSKLDFINKYNYGFEIRVGYSNYVLFARYRASDYVNTDNVVGYLPKISFGFEIEVSTSGKY